MTSVAVIMLTYFCANIMLGLGLLKRHEDLVAQREQNEQFTKECEERMKKAENYNPTLARIQKKYEEKQNKVEPLIFPEEYDVTTYGVVMLHGSLTENTVDCNGQYFASVRSAKPNGRLTIVTCNKEVDE